MKFNDNILNGFQVIERTRLGTDGQTDGQTDRQMDIQLRQKQYVSTPVRGRQNTKLHQNIKLCTIPQGNCIHLIDVL